MPEPFDLHKFIISQGVQNIGFGNAVSNDVLTFLDRMAIDVEIKIQQASTQWSKLRAQQMLTEIHDLTRATRDQMLAHVEGKARVIGQVQAQATTGALVQTVSSVVAVESIVPGKILAIVNSEAFNGRIMRDWFAAWEKSVFESMKQQVWLGFGAGESPQQIAARLIGNIDQTLLRGASAGGRRYRGIFVSARRNARTIARTAMNHAGNQARLAVFEANADVVEKVEWDATLDHATCPVCGGRDGQTFAFNVGPRPPAHPNCRCIMLPVIDPEFLPDNLTPGQKASASGPTAATENYNSWLKRQKLSGVERVLGKKKAKLFKTGNLPIDRFVDDAGFTLNLEELKQLNPKKWAQAFSE